MLFRSEHLQGKEKEKEKEKEKAEAYPQKQAQPQVQSQVQSQATQRFLFSLLQTVIGRIPTDFVW